MFDNKFLATLIGLSLAVYASSSFLNMKDSNNKENFLGTLPSFTVRKERDVVCVPTNKSSDMYMVPGTYQSMLPPRFSNTNYGANIQYNIPCRQVLGTPETPVPLPPSNNNANAIDMSNMVQEGYCAPCSKSNSGCNQVQMVQPQVLDSCCSTNVVTPSGFASGNYNEVQKSAQMSYNAKEYPDVQSMIPVGTMDSLGESCQPVVYDRYIYANRRSRLRSQGDPIRGDLPIVPCNTGWFRPSVNAHIDLHEGAMNVLGGVSNETAQTMNQLIDASSGGAIQTVGGVNMAQAYDTDLCAAGNDVLISAYP